MTKAEIERIAALMEEASIEYRARGTVEIPLDVWLAMNAIADALDGGDKAND